MVSRPWLSSRISVWPADAHAVPHFDTVAEIARAAAVVEQAQARERAIQARAVAAAATNAHLLEGLDAFRGLHLDPNVAHWDDVSGRLISVQIQELN